MNSVPPQPVIAPTGADAGLLLPTTRRARGMGADALAAVSDYAKALARGADAKTRGEAAHRAGRAVLDLAAYAEELEGRVAS